MAKSERVAKNMEYEMNVAAQLLEEHEGFEEAEHLVDVEGMSTPKVCNFLNKMVASLGENESYLEIGTWKGLTLCSAIYGNAGKACYACDKFRIWGRFTGWGFQAKRALLKNVEKYSAEGAKVHFFHMNSNALFRKGLVPPNVKVYFYDGDHSFQGTKEGILKAIPLLLERSYLLVDDFRGEEIAAATREAIEETGLKILWERNLTREEGWWNGLGVFWLEKP